MLNLTVAPVDTTEESNHAKKTTDFVSYGDELVLYAQPESMISKMFLFTHLQCWLDHILK